MAAPAVFSSSGAYQLRKLSHQLDRKVIHTVKSHILKHFKGCRLSGSAHSRYDDKTHNLLLLCTVCLLPAPEKLLLSVFIFKAQKLYLGLKANA